MFHSVNKFRTPVTILLGLIAVSFVGYGFVAFQGASSDNYIVKVGDQAITRYALDQAVQNTEAAGGQANREAVFQTLLQRAYLMEGAKQLGIVVSDEQIKQIVVDTPQFHDSNGKFDPKLFQDYLANTRQSEQSFMETQRENLIVTALLQTLGSNVVSDFQAQQVINAALSARSTRAYVLNPQAFADKVKVDDAALKKYYEANKKDFLLQQGAKFEYIVLSPKDIASKQAVSDAEIEAAYNASKGSLKPKRHIAHILIEAPKSADAATREKAKAEAEKIAAEAKAHPEQFAELAKRVSQDVGSAANGGDLGEIAQDGKIGSQALEDAAFTLNKGEVSGVVESDFGYHIVRVLDIADVSLDAQKDSIRSSLQAKKAQQEYNKQREELSEAVFNARDKLQPAAQKFGLTVQTQNEWITKANAGSLKVPTAVAEALLAGDVFGKKLNSAAINVDGETWFIRATETRPESTETFEQAKSRVEERFKLAESRRLALEHAKNLQKELEAGNNPAVAWSPVQEVAPMQVRSVLSDDAYLAFMKAIPKNGKPAYTVLDLPAAPQLVEVQSIQTINSPEALQNAKLTLTQNMGESLIQDYIEALAATVKTQQGIEKVSGE